MDKSEAIKLAGEYKDLVCRHFNIKETILFGSYSKGTQHKDSDIDVALIVDEFPGEYFDTVPFLWKLGRQIDCRIEPILICRKTDRAKFLDEVMRTGIVI
ncbi:putative nucleotidyltransferase [Bacteroidales bacterium Barb4]|nr:putative nucleotidyltransferase [Bacteroidales bacterium Barb4]